MSKRRKPGPKRRVGRPISKKNRIRDRERKADRRSHLLALGLVEVRAFVDPKHRDWILESSRKAIAEAELDAARASGDQFTILSAERRLELVNNEIRVASDARGRRMATEKAARYEAERQRKLMVASMNRLSAAPSHHQPSEIAQEHISEQEAKQKTMPLPERQAGPLKSERELCEVLKATGAIGVF